MQVIGSLLPLLILIIPAALALAGIFGIPALIDRSRRNAHAAFCSIRGYEYQPSRRGAQAAYADVVSMFKIGDGHQWRHEISGQFNDRPFTAFEYRYGEGAGRMRTAYVEAMMHWRLTGFFLPQVTRGRPHGFPFLAGKYARARDFSD